MVLGNILETDREMNSERSEAVGSLLDTGVTCSKKLEESVLVCLAVFTQLATGLTSKDGFDEADIG